MKKITVLFFLAIFIGLFGASAHADLTRGLQGHWKFSGDANDSAGDNNDLTVSGATLTTDKYGNTNGAYDFEADNGDKLYITDANHDGLDITEDLSIAAWVNLESYLANARTIVMKGLASGDERAYWFYCTPQNGDTRCNFYISSDGTTTNRDIIYWDLTTDLVTGVWAHLAVTYDASASEYKIYVNGVQEGSTLTGSETSINDSSSDFQIGLNYGTTDAWDGKLDDVRVYNRVLTATEIFTLAHPADCDEDGDVDFDDLSCKHQDLTDWTEDDFIPNME